MRQYETEWQARLEVLAERGALRHLQAASGLVDFASNDYLGLARDQDLLNRIADSVQSLEQLGATGSRLLSGQTEFVEGVETELAAFYRAESTLLFPSAYQANLALLASLPGKDDTLLFDERVHASMRQGIQLSPAISYPFRHNDLEHLGQRLSRVKGRAYVCVEGLYSMDGDWAPLKEMAKLCDRYAAALIVDEAHSTGICGPEGSGACSRLNIQDLVAARVHGFGKAVGFQGACVAVSESCKQLLVNQAFPFIYTTGISHLNLLAIRECHRRLRAADRQRAELWNRVDRYSELLGATKQRSPIRSIEIPGNEAVVRRAQELQSAGFDVRAIRSPTVRRGTERLRIVLHAYNSDSEIEALFKATEETSLCTH